MSPHGSNSRYTNSACRCNLCRLAHKAYEQKANSRPGGRRHGRFTRQRVQRDPRAPLDREHLSELTLAEMDAHGLVIVTCSLCMRVMIREEGAERCRMKAACRERQRRNGWVQMELIA